MPLINGDDGPNFIVDTPDDDTINGLAGDDTITVTNGNDQANGGDDFDTLVVSYGGATTDISGGINNAGYGDLSTQNVGFGQFERFEITTGSGNDTIGTGVFGNGNDIVNLGAGNDFAETGVGDDEANGGAGNDLIDVGTGDDTADGGADTDRISANLSAAVSSIVWILPSNFYSGPIGSFTNFEYFGIVSTGDGNDAIVTGTGNFDETVNLGGGDDTITVSLGGDSVNGQGGNDTLIVSYGGSTAAVTNGLNSYGNGVDRNVVYAAFESFVITTGSGNDVISTASGSDVVNLGGGNDFAETGVGDDEANGGAGNDDINVGTGSDIADGGADTDRISANLSAAVSSIVWILPSNFYSGPIGSFTNFEYFGIVSTGSGNDAIVTGSGNFNETVNLGDGNDTITVSRGSDSVNGEGGADDNLIVDYGGSTSAVTSGLNSYGNGTDRNVSFAGFEQFVVTTGSGDDVISTASFSGDDFLTLNAGNDLAATGAGNDSLDGGAGADALDGGSGADQMTGGDGNDLFFVDNVGDQAIETSVLSTGGIDTVQSEVSFTLGANIERLTLVGAALNGTGNAINNVITGNGSNNLLNGLGGADNLDGGLGADTMAGGLGNDTYVVDNGSDTVTEAVGEGTDTVQSAISFTLGANLENLTLTGVGNVNATGNALVNILVGNAGNNTLNGLAGADTMNGGLGNDTYVVDNAGDTAGETVGGGTDLVQSSVTFTLASNIENLTLTGLVAVNGTGNNLANSLTGNNAANILNGGFGADTMSGGLGNDTYVIDNAGDFVTEAAGAGTDTVQTSLNHILGANFERLVLTGTGNLIGTGNSLANIITGNSGANQLDGGAGGDTMIGGLGNDSYFVDTGLDIVIEAAGGGTDTVYASLSHDLEDEVENLTLTGVGATNGLGNSLANTLTGNDAANRLDGGLGVDMLKGGLGDDIYVVDQAGDVVSELAGQGTDKVESAISYTLAAAVENLTLTGSGNTNGTGNLFANILIGTSGANRLDGSGGADTMNGGLGNDTYVVDNVGDVVIESSPAGGTDTVESSVTFILGPTLENLTLTGANPINGTGNALGNTLTGNNAANSLNGLGGDDSLFGKGGNDTIVTGGGADGIYFDTALNAASNVDSITDLAVASDTLFLDDGIFTGIAAGTLAAGAFRIGLNALDADDRILYDIATGRIFYDSDGTGAAAQILFATVAVGTALTNADFIVY